MREAEDYTNDWYDVEVYGLNSWSEFKVTAPLNSGDLYFNVHIHELEQTSGICLFVGGYPAVSYTVGDVTSTSGEPILVKEADYTEGQEFTVIVDPQFGFFPYPSFTVSVYSTQSLDITDPAGETNMLHMDGQVPSGYIERVEALIK